LQHAEKHYRKPDGRQTRTCFKTAAQLSVGMRRERTLGTR
jgi:hypothetical protein